MKTSFINLTTAGRLLGVSQPTVYKLIRQGILKAVRTGNRQRLVRSDVVKLSQEGWTWDV